MKRSKGDRQSNPRGSLKAPDVTLLPPAPSKRDLGLLFVELKHQKPRRSGPDGLAQELDVLLFGGGPGAEGLNSFLASKSFPVASRVESAFAAAKERSPLGRALTHIALSMLQLIEEGVEAADHIPEMWDQYVREHKDSLAPFLYELQGFSTLLTYLWCQIASAEVRYWWALKQQWSDVIATDSVETPAEEGPSGFFGGFNAPYPPPGGDGSSSGSGSHSSSTSAGSAAAPPAKRHPDGSAKEPEEGDNDEVESLLPLLSQNRYIEMDGSHGTRPPHSELLEDTPTAAEERVKSDMGDPGKIPPNVLERDDGEGGTRRLAVETEENPARHTRLTPMEVAGHYDDSRIRLASESLDPSAIQRRVGDSGRRGVVASPLPGAAGGGKKSRLQQQSSVYGSPGSDPSLGSNPSFSGGGLDGSPPTFQPPPPIVPEWVQQSRLDPPPFAGAPRQTLHEHGTPQKLPFVSSGSPLRESEDNESSGNTVLTALSPLYAHHPRLQRDEGDKGSGRRMGSGRGQQGSVDGHLLVPHDLPLPSSSQNNPLEDGKKWSERGAGHGHGMASTATAESSSAIGVTGSWSFHGFTSLNKPLRKSSMWASFNQADLGKPPAPPPIGEEDESSPTPQETQHQEENKVSAVGTVSNKRGGGGTPRNAQPLGPVSTRSRKNFVQYHLNTNHLELIPPSPDGVGSSAPSPRAISQTDSLAAAQTPFSAHKHPYPNSNVGTHYVQPLHRSLGVPQSLTPNHFVTRVTTPPVPVMVITSTSPSSSTGNSPKPSHRRVTAVPNPSTAPRALEDFSGAADGDPLQLVHPLLRQASSTSGSSGTAPTRRMWRSESRSSSTNPSLTPGTSPVLQTKEFSSHNAFDVFKSSRMVPRPQLVHLHRHENLACTPAALAAKKAEALSSLQVTVKGVTTVKKAPAAKKVVPLSSAESLSPTFVTDVSAAPRGLNHTELDCSNSCTRSFHGSAMLPNGPVGREDRRSGSGTHLAGFWTSEPAAVAAGHGGAVEAGGGGRSACTLLGAEMPECLKSPKLPTASAIAEVARQAKERNLQKKLGVRKVVNYAEERDLEDYTKNLDEEMEALFRNDVDDATVAHFNVGH